MSLPEEFEIVGSGQEESEMVVIKKETMFGRARKTEKRASPVSRVHTKFYISRA